MSTSRASIKTHLSIALIALSVNGATLGAFHPQINLFGLTAHPAVQVPPSLNSHATVTLKQAITHSVAQGNNLMHTPSDGASPSSTLQLSQSNPRTIFENVRLSPQFTPDPTIVRGISGGDRPASELAEQTNTATGPCVGFVDEQPDHTMELTQFFNYLSLQVQSPQDTTLVVRGPGGTWCNDDYEDMNPAIAGQWLSGTYHIWVGSYANNQYSPYVIRISGTR